MTREEFIEVLDKKGHSYKIEGNKMTITNDLHIYSGLVTSLPPGVVFINNGDVGFRYLTSIPSGVEFKNGGGVHLPSLTSLPPGVVFNNTGSVWMESLTSIPPGVEFNNGKGVNLGSLIGGWFEYWKSNIEGINNNMLLNKMIKDGLFDRR